MGRKSKVIKMHDDALAKCVKLTDHFIETGIKQLKWTLTNGFVITLKDGKRNRKNAK